VPLSAPRPQLLDRLRDAIRRKHYSLRTEQSYIHWIRWPGMADGKPALWFRLRLMECVRLRVKDLDFERRQVLVRDGKGQKDRVTVLPDGLIAHLKTHLDKVRVLHEGDLAAGFGTVELPYALEGKYPNANREWASKYIFERHSTLADLVKYCL